MRTISVYYDGGLYTWKWLKTILAIKKEMRTLDYKVENFYFQPWKSLEKREMDNIAKAQQGEHDIVLLAFHHSTSHLCNLSVKERAEVLQKIHKHCKKLIWMDTADSTGTCMFDVMPHVDVYFKKQILKDFSLYTKEMYGSRIFCEYYHQRLGREDNNIANVKYILLDPRYCNKIALSWNVGYGDLHASKYDLLLHQRSISKPTFTPPYSNKRIDLHFRGSSYSPIAGYQREISKELVDGLKGISHPNASKPVPHKEYIKELTESKAILSPFGWGEICGRDFEAFVYGATLIKPNMSHCITYPDCYIPNETYIPLEWDFSNFEEVVSKIGSKEYLDIAEYAQKQYLQFYTSSEQRMQLAMHIVQGIELKQKV